MTCRRPRPWPGSCVMLIWSMKRLSGVSLIGRLRSPQYISIWRSSSMNRAVAVDDLDALQIEQLAHRVFDANAFVGSLRLSNVDRKSIE